MAVKIDQAAKLPVKINRSMDRVHGMPFSALCHQDTHEPVADRQRYGTIALTGRHG